MSFRVAFATVDEPLLAFVFSDGGRPDDERDHGGARLTVACPRLAGPSAPETWVTDALGVSAAREGVPGRSASAFVMRVVEVEEAPEPSGTSRPGRRHDILSATERAYRALLADTRDSAHPCILRIWNYFAAINAGHGDGERYRCFCVGRARAVDVAFSAPPPAATAIGTVGEPGRVQVVALCGERPGIALENPRQTPAWRYPREYGPVPPGFSRGALVGTGEGARLLASGTASIVGHVSRHPDDIEGQLTESLTNLDALLAEGGGRGGQRFALAGCEALRVYLRRAEDLPIAQAVIADAGLPSERTLYLRGDICRRELLVELEGVFAPG